MEKLAGTGSLLLHRSLGQGVILDEGWIAIPLNQEKVC
jgi:hypothetical protein